MEKAREFQKNIYFCFIDYSKPLTVWITKNCGKLWKRWEYQTTSPASWETPVLWSPHWKSWLIGKDSDTGRDWGQEEKGPTEDEMAGWHHWLYRHESEWTPGVGDGQGGLACCDSWGHKEPDTTEWLNWTELNACLCAGIIKNNDFNQWNQSA